MIARHELRRESLPGDTALVTALEVEYAKSDLRHATYRLVTQIEGRLDLRAERVLLEDAPAHARILTSLWSDWRRRSAWTFGI
jgi:hypothetical protein